MKDLLDDIKKEQFKPVYLLYGEEAFLLQDYKKRLCEALLPADDLMNFTRQQGEKADVQEIIDLGQTQPFFADRRVILLENTGFFKKSPDELVDFMTRLPETLVLIFAEETVDKRSRLYKAVKQAGRIACFDRLRSDRLVSWATVYLQKQGVTIQRAAAAALVEQVGVDMGLLKMEMDKLISYTEGSREISIQDIQRICTVHLENRIFDMLRAITARDQKKALELYEDLLALKEPPVKILVLLGRQYSQLRKAKELSGQQLPSKELASAIGVAPFAVSGIMNCSKDYTSEEILNAIQTIVETDELIKTGKMTDRLAVELLIIQLLQK